jgi:hypothetical protein
MALTPSSLTIEIPIFAAVNGKRYDVGSIALPVGIHAEHTGDTVTLTGKVDVDTVVEEFRQAFATAADRVVQRDRSSSWAGEARIVPDYAADSLLVDIVARIRYRQARELTRIYGRGSWEAWESVSEGIRQAWRETSELEVRKATPAW